MKKTKSKNKRVPTYEFGTLITNPNKDLIENEIAMIKAANKASNNGWVKGTKIFGNLAQQVGMGMMNSKGAGSSTPGGGEVATEGFGGSMNSFFGNNKGDSQSLMNLLSGFGNSGGFAFGGKVPVEVEGKETGETPDGQLLDFMGPSHEEGGIDVALPAGTEIYSKRIKIDGVSMADRKRKREKKAMTFEELLSKNSHDKLLINSLERTKETNQTEEDADNKIQQVVKQIFEGTKNTHAFGDTVEDPNNPLAAFLSMLQNNGAMTDNQYGGFGNNTPSSATPPINNTDNSFLTGMVNKNPGTDTEGKGFGLSDITGDATLGDAVGMMGTLYSTFAPMKNTKANRAGDTPNINAFEDFGKDGLETLDKSKQYIAGVKAEKLKDLELARTGSITRNRNSARSVNTQRALDLATDAGVNNTKEETYNSFAESMMAILGTEAGMKNQKDQVVMGGEQARDLADRQDRDNYFSQLAQDIATKGTGLQETGKDMNKMKQNKVMMNLLNQLSAYGITVDAQGNLSNK